MKQPPLTIPATIEVPEAAKHTALNGTPIYAINCPEYEVVRVSFVFHAGSTTQRHPFTASATANMLAEGSRNLTSQQIAEKLDYYGSYFDINIDRDYSYITFCALSKFFTQTAEVIEEVILHPTFPEAEVATYRDKRRQQLAIERRKVETIARENFAHAIFGEKHPYGVSYPESAYDTLCREHIEEHYRSRYSAENCIVVCSGAISDEVLQRITDIASQIPSSNALSTVEFPPYDTRYNVRVQHDGAMQSSIRMGRLLFPRSHEEFVPMQVLSTLLGGYFGSRLMQNLREMHGYTYGVMAAMINFEKEGYLAIATQVTREHSEDALREIYYEIERLRNELMPEEELQMAKNMMIGEILRILDGPFGIADVTIENIMCGLDNSSTEQNVEIINAITPEEVQRLAQKYLRHEDLIEVVVG